MDIHAMNVVLNACDAKAMCTVRVQCKSFLASKTCSRTFYLISHGFTSAHNSVTKRYLKHILRRQTMVVVRELNEEHVRMKRTV